MIIMMMTIFMMIILIMGITHLLLLPIPARSRLASRGLAALRTSRARSRSTRAWMSGVFPGARWTKLYEPMQYDRMSGAEYWV